MAVLEEAKETGGGFLDGLKNMFSFGSMFNGLTDWFKENPEKAQEAQEADEAITKKSEERRGTLIMDIIAHGANALSGLKNEGGILGFFGSVAGSIGTALNARTVLQNIDGCNDIISTENAFGKLALAIDSSRLFGPTEYIAQSVVDNIFPYFSSIIQFLSQVPGVDFLGGPTHKAFLEELKKKEEDPKHKMDLQIVARELSLRNPVGNFIFDKLKSLGLGDIFEKIKNTFSSFGKHSFSPKQATA